MGEKAPVGSYLKEPNFTLSAIGGGGVRRPQVAAPVGRASGFRVHFVTSFIVLLPVGDVAALRRCSLSARPQPRRPLLHVWRDSARQQCGPQTAVFPGAPGVICPVVQGEECRVSVTDVSHRCVGDGAGPPAGPPGCSREPGPGRTWARGRGPGRRSLGW